MNTLLPTATTWRLSGQMADDQHSQQCVVDRSPFTVGRRSDQALTINSPTVSSRHAELVVLEEGLLVRDLGSTNGTFVNGVRVEDECLVNHGDLVQFAQVVFRSSLDAPTRSSQTVQNDSADQALALIQFDRLITDRAVLPHFQAIVKMSGELIGYELLGRSRLFGLTTPQAMFSAAAALNLQAELSRIMRLEGVRAGVCLPAEELFFVNTHAVEIDDLDTLIYSVRELRELAPQRPLVLEIHEATATRTGQMQELRAALDDLQIGLAYDDFGAGQARLVDLAEAPPDYLKFDMQLVQGIASASQERQKMLARLVQMTLDLGIEPLAEGLEQREDSLLCEQIGFTCAQGFMYGRPTTAEKLPQTVVGS